MAHHKPEREVVSPEAEALRRVESLLQRMHDATGRALRELAKLKEPLGRVWRCGKCGDKINLGKTSPVSACGSCKKCQAVGWICEVP